MAEKIIGTVSAGSSPAWEVVEDDEDQRWVTIRSVGERLEQVRIARAAVPFLAGILGSVAPDREE